MIIDKIYKIEPIVEKEDMICKVSLIFNNKIYQGEAHLHPNDKEFFSEKVGFNIALSRARIKIFKEYYNKYSQELIHRERMYKEAIQYGRIDYALVDPQGVFLKRVKNTEKICNKLHSALKQEENGLRVYIDSITKVHNTILKMRNWTKKDN